MRIVILTLGSRGDVEPYTALGLGLQAAGYQVQIAAHSLFKAFIQSRGLGFFPIAGDPQDTLQSQEGLRWLETGRNPLLFIRQMMSAAQPSAWQVLNDYWDACQDADAIIYAILPSLAAHSIGEKLGIPAIPAYTQHVHPTSAYPASGAAPIPSLGAVYNRLTYPLIGQLFWQYMRPLANRFRIQTLQLPPLPLRSPFQKMSKSSQPTLYGFSRHVLPKPPEWGEEIHITGYWVLERSTQWRPPEGLTAFLKAGPPPIFIGFGSMVARNPREMTEIAVRALAKTGQRGLLMLGWGGLQKTDLPESIYPITAAPFDWLFPKMALVVHHGGAGTTGTGLRAGVPSLIVPFFGDQPFWGWRVRELGVGPKPIPHKKLSADSLAFAIHQTLADKEMAAKAAALGKQIQSENGVAKAVSVLRQFLGKGSSPV